MDIFPIECQKCYSIIWINLHFYRETEEKDILEDLCPHCDYPKFDSMSELKYSRKDRTMSEDLKYNLDAISYILAQNYYYPK